VPFEGCDRFREYAPSSAWSAGVIAAAYATACEMEPRPPVGVSSVPPFITAFPAQWNAWHRRTRRRDNKYRRADLVDDTTQRSDGLVVIIAISTRIRRIDDRQHRLWV